MKILIDKSDGNYTTKLCFSDEADVKFDYIRFLRELQLGRGAYTLETTGDISEEERVMLEELFINVSKVFKSENPELSV